MHFPRRDLKAAPSAVGHVNLDPCADQRSWGGGARLRASQDVTFVELAGPDVVGILVKGLTRS